MNIPYTATRDKLVREGILWYDMEVVKWISPEMNGQLNIRNA